MVRAVYRFVDYQVIRDETAHPEYSAVCVTGEESDCGASSGDRADEGKVIRWIAEHRRDTGHGRYRRNFADYATATPVE